MGRKKRKNLNDKIVHDFFITWNAHLKIPKLNGFLFQYSVRIILWTNILNFNNLRTWIKLANDQLIWVSLWYVTLIKSCKTPKNIMYIIFFKRGT